MNTTDQSHTVHLPIPENHTLLVHVHVKLSAEEIAQLSEAYDTSQRTYDEATIAMAAKYITDPRVEIVAAEEV